MGVDVGVDSAKVLLIHLGKLIDERFGLLAFIRGIVQVWGLGTTKVAKVERHAAD